MEYSQSLQPAVILVTGGHGLLGSRVLPLLAENNPGGEILVVARKEKQRADSSAQIRTIIADLRDENLWALLPTTITHVFHLAAVIPWKAEDKYKASVVTDNLLPTAYLIEHSQRWPRLAQVIYSSSVSVYAPTAQTLSEDSPKQPATLYGVAKLAGEQLLGCLETRNVRMVSLRLSSLYASGQYQGTVLPMMVKRAIQKQDLLIFGDGTRTQDFLHCEDAARAVLLAFQKQAHGAYNIGTGTAVNMTELAQAVNAIFANGESRLVYRPQNMENDHGIKLDISKARRELDFQPRLQLEEGLRHLQQEMIRDSVAAPP